jgi:lysophospholipase L1-like esterase
MRHLYEYHPVVGYRYIPNLKARVRNEGGGYLIQVNEAGFRSNRSFMKPRTAGSRRMLVFGDSFTAGDSVPNHQRFTDLLETRLPACEVYNFGLSSTGTDQQYLIWREFAQGIEHDLVVIAVFVENVRRVAARYRPHCDEFGREHIYAKPYYTLERGSLQLHHMPPRPEPFEDGELSPDEKSHIDSGGRFPLLRKLVTTLGVREVVQHLTRYQPVPAYDSPDTADWKLMRAILTQWIRAIDKPVLLMPLPLPQHIDELCDAAPYQARFAELAAELGCTLHDPLPDLLRYLPGPRRRLRWEKDIHFTAEGHDALARSLAPVSERLLAGAYRQEKPHG